jgi:hypothetical protein
MSSAGRLLLGNPTESTFLLDVLGATRLNGLATIQGTTASDSAPLGSELATTGSGANWTGSAFATGYTHVVGSTAPLTTSTPAVSGTYYQIAYTVTGRTAGSFTINYGGTSTAGLTATGATGPLASSTANLEIVPTTDFDGTIILSIRTIGTSSATTTFRDSGGTMRLEFRTPLSSENTIVGANAGRRITTGNANSFVGSGAGTNTTTGAFNSFFGSQAGILNTTGNFNVYIGSSAGTSGTSATGNVAIGGSSLSLNTTGSNNIAFGGNSGRSIADGVTANTATSNSIFIGANTRANADNQTNQIVIGHTAIGLGTNTTVIGNSSTSFGRWWGNLLLGTSTNSTFILDVVGTTRLTGTLTLTSNIILPTSGGTRIGTATNQLLSFWNKFLFIFEKIKTLAIKLSNCIHTVLKGYY